MALHLRVLVDGIEHGGRLYNKTDCCAIALVAYTTQPTIVRIPVSTTFYVVPESSMSCYYLIEALFHSSVFIIDL